jgi:hypothetical protein
VYANEKKLTTQTKQNKQIGILLAKSEPPPPLRDPLIITLAILASITCLQLTWRDENWKCVDYQVMSTPASAALLANMEREFFA